MTQSEPIETELRASEERLSRVLETTAEGIALLDASGRLTLVNAALEKILGVARDEIIGRILCDPIPKVETLDGTRVAAEEFVAARALRTGEQISGVEYRIERPDGRRVTVAVDAGPVRAASGAIVGVVLSVRDITEQKRGENQREQLVDRLGTERRWLQTVIEHAPAGILLYQTPGGVRVVANPRAEELFGRRLVPEGGVAQYVRELFHPDGRPMKFEELPSIRALNGELVVGTEITIRQPTGREVAVISSSAPIRDQAGNVIGAVGVFEDITPIKELEREREEWTSVIAHDLRQPVTVIDGYAKLLLQHADQYPPPVRAQVEHILTSTTQLNRMIADLLDVTGIEARRLTLDCRLVDFPAFLRSVVERTAALTGGHTVRVTIDDNIPRFEFDPGRIEQVLGNLISNAAKFGYPDTPILLAVERRDAEIEVAVTNQGPGIEPEELPKLFRRFYRTAEARAAQVAGIGLGLYITRGLVEAHGGRIWAESVPGQTTSFRFTLAHG